MKFWGRPSHFWADQGDQRTLGGRPTVGIGKEIVKNVSVFAGRNLNEERGVYEHQVGIQYKVNKHLSIESQMGPRNSGADVIFNYDF